MLLKSLPQFWREGAENLVLSLNTFEGFVKALPASPSNYEENGDTSPKGSP